MNRLGFVWITMTVLGMLHSVAAPIALAESPVRYTPPSRQNPERTVSGGRRGQGEASCQLQDGRSLQVSLLVPAAASRESPLTISSQPRLYWFATGEGTAMAEFTLSEADTGKVVVRKQISLHPGLGSIQVPKSAALKTNQEYIWSLLTACDLYNANEIYVRSFVRRVSVPSALSQALQSSTSLQEQGAAYAQFGIWYDALSALIESPDTEASARLLLKQGQVTGVEI